MLEEIYNIGLMMMFQYCVSGSQNNTVANHRLRWLRSDDLRTMAERDDFVNQWGCNLVSDYSGTAARGPALNVTESSLQALVSSSCQGMFKYHSLHGSGSAANHCAMDLATKGEVSSCLVAMGSYVAGNGSSLQLLSSSTYTAKQSLATVASPYDESVSLSCKKQTVPFPYHVPHDRLSPSHLKDFEKKCLKELERAILMGVLSGKMFRCLMFEPILSGCGGELSRSFLRDLGLLLERYGIVVIVDEILTAGRVGPSMLMSTGFPQEIINCIKYVTMGKIIGNGMVLSKACKKPQEATFYRGTSTMISPATAYGKWKTIQGRINDGYIDARREEVLKLYGLSRSPNEHWGRGCLIFMQYARYQVNQGLKSRLLPKLENVRCNKLQVKRTPFSRERVCKMLQDAAEEWISARNEQYENKYSPFLVRLVDFMLSRELESNLVYRGYFEVVPGVFLEYIGEHQVCKMEEKRKDFKRAKHTLAAPCKRDYQKKAKSIIHSALNEISEGACQDSFVSCRIGSSRRHRLAGYRFFPTSALDVNDSEP